MLKETSAVRIASIPESQRLVAEFQGRIPHFLSSSSNKKKGGHCWAPKLCLRIRRSSLFAETESQRQHAARAAQTQCGRFGDSDD